MFDLGLFKISHGVKNPNNVRFPSYYYARVRAITTNF